MKHFEYQSIGTVVGALSALVSVTVFGLDIYEATVPMVLIHLGAYFYYLLKRGDEKRKRGE